MRSLKRVELTIEQRKIELSEKDFKLREEELEFRKKDHAINSARNWRERWLFIFAIGSLLISLVSLWIAGLAFWVACLPK